jgi:hypothetical protein
MQWVLIGVLFLCSCSPNSSKEFYREGNARSEALIRDLEKIETRQQLIHAESKLKKHFESLVILMIEAREFQQKKLDAPDIEAIEESSANERLETELRRIYAIEGGREIIERAEAEGLAKLDAYERSLIKKRAHP